MKVEKFVTVEALTNKVTEKMIKLLADKPEAVFCIAGGETPLPVMKKLIQLQKTNKIDFSKATFISLDEWIGLDRTTKGSCIQTLEDHLFQPLGLRAEQIKFFDGKATNLTAELTKMNTFVAAYGIDFILLGLGMNGHIGFNEPGVTTEANAQIVGLDEVTTTVMTKYFNEKLPLTQGITLGFRQILDANQIILMATGEKKAEIVKATIEGEPTSQVPSTILKQAQNEALFFVDRAAGKFI